MTPKWRGSPVCAGVSAQVTAYLRLAQGIVALLLICVGVALWSIPAALVVGGVLLLVDRLT